MLIIAASSFSIFFAYRLFAPTPAYEFKTGINHPAVISNLLKNGTVVVLYFSMNNCPPCDEMPPKIADLQSQYKGTEVTILTLNVSDNATAQQLARNYGIQSIPQVFVIRPDGAVANVTSENYPYIDFNVIRSAIEDARHGSSEDSTALIRLEVGNRKKNKELGDKERLNEARYSLACVMNNDVPRY